MARLSPAGGTGAGLARDLALRGLSVLLPEKDDWGGGTSGACLRPYPLLAAAGSGAGGWEPDWAAATAAGPVGVLLEEVAGMVRRLSRL